MSDNKKYWVAAGFLFGVMMLVITVVAAVMYVVEMNVIQRMPR